MFRLDPWSEERADFRAGSIVATIRNALRGEGESCVDPLDTQPDYDGSRYERKVRATNEASQRYYELMSEPNEE